MERGRHTKPKTPLKERLCPNCHALEDEQHFVMECALYDTQRGVFINNIIASYPEFGKGNVNKAFGFVLQTAYPKIQKLFAKIVYDAFQTKTSHVAAQN